MLFFACWSSGLCLSNPHCRTGVSIKGKSCHRVILQNVFLCCCLLPMAACQNQRTLANQTYFGILGFQEVVTTHRKYNIVIPTSIQHWHSTVLIFIFSPEKGNKKKKKILQIGHGFILLKLHLNIRNIEQGPQDPVDFFFKYLLYYPGNPPHLHIRCRKSDKEDI